MARWPLGCPGPRGLAVPACFVSWDAQGHCWTSFGQTSEGPSALSALRGLLLGGAFTHSGLSISAVLSLFDCRCPRIGLSKDRLLLSFGAHSEWQVANTAGRSPRSPPRPLPCRRSELCDWRARKSDLGRLYPSPPGSLSEPAPRQRGFCGCHPRSMRGAHGPCR